MNRVASTGKSIRRDMGKDFRRLTLVTDSDTARWVRQTARGRSMTIAAFLDQLVQRARMRKDPLA